jgi:hypothetical protein
VRGANLQSLQLNHGPNPAKTTNEPKARLNATA